MTPEEKAKELVGRFKYPDELSNGNIWCKQCALIAVEEILMFDINPKCESQFVIQRRIEDYWQEVKQQINKL